MWGIFTNLKVRINKNELEVAHSSIERRTTK